MYRCKGDDGASHLSLDFHFIKEYATIEYNCWSCKKASIFSAEDQKYTYEVKKAYIWQRRVLCAECWNNSISIKNNIVLSEKKWLESKKILKHEVEFLKNWLEQLILYEKYEPYKPNTATKNMLNKLINKIS